MRCDLNWSTSAVSRAFCAALLHSSLNSAMPPADTSYSLTSSETSAAAWILGSREAASLRARAPDAVVVVHAASSSKGKGIHRMGLPATDGAPAHDVSGCLFSAPGAGLIKARRLRF